METITMTQWQELLGSNNWEGLLEPLDLNLRLLILRCGDFCQATYDAFNHDKNFSNSGTSKYSEEEFFKGVMLESASDYQLLCFLFASAEGEIDVQPLTAGENYFRTLLVRDRKSNLMGYIATTTDEASSKRGRREIYVVWRGTVTSYEWKDVSFPCLKSVKPLLSPEHAVHPGGAAVSNGWLKIYHYWDPESNLTKYSARKQLKEKIQELTEKYKDENPSIIVTGHSLGACLAVISAFDLVENWVKDIRVSAIVFCSPQVGNCAFRKMVNQFPNLKILRINNKRDLITFLPSCLLGYVDTGIELKLDSYISPCLKRRCCHIWDGHNLQALLHVVAGWNGPNGNFELKVKRSLALVNKYSDLLKDEYNIPDSWWIEKNKGLILDQDGEWKYGPSYPAIAQ